jgi:hypothetical protein
MDDTPVKLAKIVHNYMVDNQITGQEFTMRAGLYRGKIYDILNCRIKDVSATMFFKLARAMHMDPEDLARAVDLEED